MTAQFISDKIGNLDVASWLTILGFIGSSLAAMFAAVRYLINGRQEHAARKRNQALKAADEIDTFYEHHSVWLATRIIDYKNFEINKTDLDCPDKNMTANETWECLVHHADPDFLAARNISDVGPVFTHDQRRVRDLFDRFLTKLERIEKLVANEVISKEDFADFFSYWLQLMTEIPFDSDTATHFSDERRERLWKYIRGYQYNGVVRLFALYNRAQPVGAAADKAFKNRKQEVGEEPCMRLGKVAAGAH